MFSSGSGYCAQHQIPNIEYGPSSPQRKKRTEETLSLGSLLGGAAAIGKECSYSNFVSQPDNDNNSNGWLHLQQLGKIHLSNLEL